MEDDEFMPPEESFFMQRNNQVYIYTGIIGALFVVSLSRTAGFMKACLRSSISLHRSLFHGVLRAPMRFFEVNPIGKIHKLKG